MLHSLKYQVQFSATGKSLTGDLTFSKGLTGITGPNEAGKSTTLEMARFALFGTAALRAPLKEYQKISVDLTLTIKGTMYVVTRTKGTATLMSGGNVIATGSTPVTSKIESLLGYGLTVFDIANFCQQDEVTALTKMKPTERKMLVDRVIGLNAMDTATKNAASERQVLQSQLKGLVAGIGTKPISPIAPPEYRLSSEIIAELDVAKPLLHQWHQDTAWLEAVPTAPPTPPNSCRVTDDVEAWQKNRQQVITLRQQLEREIGDVQEPQGDLDEIETWLDQQDFIAKYGEPSQWTEQDLQEMLDQNSAARERERLQNQLATSPQTTCPSCGTSFRYNTEELSRRLDALGDVEASSFGDDAIRGLLYNAKAWRVRAKPWVDGNWEGSRQTLMRMRRYQAKLPQIQQLASLDIPTDRSDELRDKFLYEGQCQAYAAQLKAHRALMSEYATRRHRYEENEEIQGIITILEQEKERSVEYEMRLKVFTEQANAWDEKQKAVTELEEQVEEWDRALKAIKELRVRVKTYLMPSLNKVASNLLNQMTGGARTSIVISEDFGLILVDGQTVETLSGSAKAVTNLAIRLGLGRVLTNSVLSLFMGDEIDASMDTDRANYTAECLKNLLGSTEQIILVSHHNLDVQHRISL